MISIAAASAPQMPPFDPAVSQEAVWNIVLPPIAPHANKVGESIKDVYRTRLSSESARRILRTGISSRVITPLGQFLGIGTVELANILNLDRTTAQRRAGKDQALPLHSAESVLRVLELEALAADTFETEEVALGWLRRPHPMLDGDSPLTAAKTSYGAQSVKDILVAIKYGGAV